jgi:hypothetical protein
MGSPCSTSCGLIMSQPWCCHMLQLTFNLKSNSLTYWHTLCCWMYAGHSHANFSISLPTPIVTQTHETIHLKIFTVYRLLPKAAVHKTFKLLQPTKFFALQIIRTPPKHKTGRTTHYSGTYPPIHTIGSWYQWRPYSR